MCNLAEARTISVEEYLAGEAVATVRHEYVAGEVFAMAGASDEHATTTSMSRRCRVAMCAAAPAGSMSRT